EKARGHFGETAPIRFRGRPALSPAFHTAKHLPRKALENPANPSLLHRSSCLLLYRHLNLLSQVMSFTLN
ncbi:MAG: hypothetical protein ACLTLW_08315, partial [Sutterella wadsworthensis]